MLLRELRALEDAAIGGVLAMQDATGIAVLSDGERRRSAWGNGVIDALNGLVAAKPGGGQAPRRWQGANADLAECTTPPRHHIATGKLSQKRSFAADEARFLKECAGGPIKITMPSPSMFTRLYDPHLSREAYGSMDELLDDLAGLYLEEIAVLHKIGVPYLQLDSMRYIDTIGSVAKGKIQPAEAR